MLSSSTATSRLTEEATLAQVRIVRSAAVPAAVGQRSRLSRVKGTFYWLSFLAGLYWLLAAWGMAQLAWPHARAHFNPWLLGALTGLACAGGAALGLFRSIWADAAVRRRFVFSHVLAGFVLTSVALLVRLGGLAAAPAWPRRDLRPARLVSSSAAPAVLPAGAESFTDFNSWGVRDLERSVRKPAGKYRVVCIGDSFLEGGFTSFPVPLLTEKLLAERGIDDVECVNLGISGTDPKQYYHRLRNVGRHLQPDSVLVFLYAGNDCLRPEQKFRMDGRELVTRGLDELPQPSFLGHFCPELTWLLWNRLNFRPPAPSTVAQPDEFTLLLEWTALPYEAGVGRLARYMHRQYFPEFGCDQVEAVLTRGGPAFWAELQDRPKEREYLQGWIVVNLLERELRRAWYPTGAADIEPVGLRRSVKATTSWLLAMNELCQAAGVPLLAVLCPGAGVDPEYMDFWNPWPRFRGKNFLFEARQAEMGRQLREKGMNCLDLAEVLQGVENVYRKTDAHWNERGHRLVAQRLAEEIQAARRRPK